MLTAGDEFGRTQHGNNNAYAQDNAITWLDWEGRDRELEAWTARLSALRRTTPALGDPRLLTGAAGPDGLPDVAWLTPDGHPKTAEHWEHPEGPALAMVLAPPAGPRLAVLFNRGAAALRFRLPPRAGHAWLEADPGGAVAVPARSVAFVSEAAVAADAPNPLEPATPRS